MPRSAKKMDSASMSLKAATIRLHRQASPKRGVEGTPFLFEAPLLAVSRRSISAILDLLNDRSWWERTFDQGGCPLTAPKLPFE